MSQPVAVPATLSTFNLPANVPVLIGKLRNMPEWLRSAVLGKS